MKVNRIVSHEQVLTTSTSLVPNVFLPNPLKMERKQDQKAVVFISSPFALVKESLLSFLHNISFHNIELYFGSDNELIIQNNMNGNDSFTQADRLVSPLPYITECIRPFLSEEISLASYSICINALPLCSRISWFYPIPPLVPYISTNFARLLDQVRFFSLFSSHLDASFEFLFLPSKSK